MRRRVVAAGSGLRSTLWIALAFLLSLSAAGCTLHTGVVVTEPSATAQRLVFRSLERALANLDLSPFLGRRVSVELVTQLKEATFARRFIVDWLKEHGVQVVGDRPDLKLDVFAHALGTDRGETFVGLPSVQTGLVPVGTPELALFKWVRNRGRTDLQVYALDPATEAFVEKTPPAVGASKWDDYTILLFINFTISDLDEPPAPRPR